MINKFNTTHLLFHTVNLIDKNTCNILGFFHLNSCSEFKSTVFINTTDVYKHYIYIYTLKTKNTKKPNKPNKPKKPKKPNKPKKPKKKKTMFSKLVWKLLVFLVCLFFLFFLVCSVFFGIFGFNVYTVYKHLVFINTYRHFIWHKSHLNISCLLCYFRQLLLLTYLGPDFLEIDLLVFLWFLKVSRDFLVYVFKDFFGF